MGREFVPLFDDWAEYYEETVSGTDKEYKEVFEDYDNILERVALKAKGPVLEFGVGTGNLTEKLILKGKDVFGVEPSGTMREKAKARFENLPIYDGDFLQFPELPAKVESIVSTYAFHHLTDEEKDLAIKKFAQLLDYGGRIIFADTAFVNELDRQERISSANNQGFHNLVTDLQREYYTTLEVLESLFSKNGFQVTFEKMNSFVWLMDAVKEK